MVYCGLLRRHPLSISPTICIAPTKLVSLELSIISYYHVDNLFQRFKRFKSAPFLQRGGMLPMPIPITL